MLRTASPGLRFLKQNVQELEILEYPMWHEYVEKLKEGWDVVGFSFYQNEIGEVLEMIEEARRQGVKELWAGNYGSIDPSIPSRVDRVFMGASEDDVAQVFGRRVRDVEHPFMTWPLSFYMTGLQIPYMNVGVLYTQHGCPFKCTFCQTPTFDHKHFPVNLESIERVLASYRKRGITDVFVLDELFGFNPAHAERVSEMLARSRMRWWAQSRVGIFMRNLDSWYDRGLRFPLVGVETMSQNAMDAVDKKQRVDDVYEFTRLTSAKKGMYRMAYYMLGYEHMDAGQSMEDVMRLKGAGFDAHQVNVITPFPGTPLWDELDSRYGVFDRTWRHYDAKYLVWNHPLISSAQMHYLLRETIKILNQPLDIYVKQFSRLIRERLSSMGLDFIWRDVVRSPVVTIFSDCRKNIIYENLPGGSSETHDFPEEAPGSLPNRAADL